MSIDANSQTASAPNITGSPHTIAPLFFGYHKDNAHVTTCLLVERNEVCKPVRILAKGISICAECDQFSRKKGRVIAEGRAYKALRLANKYGYSNGRRTFFAVKRDEAIDTLVDSGHDAAYSKAIVNPASHDFTHHELKTLNM